jgi:FkbM family methyltransferase
MKILLYLFVAIPIPQAVLYLTERLSALKQGKGWGSTTIIQEINCCISILKDSPQIVIDVGANKGLYSEELFKRYPQANFYLFEPSLSNTEVLRKKFGANNNFKIFQTAVSIATGQAKLFSDEEGSGLASLTKRNLKHFSKEMNIERYVDTIRLDEFLLNNLPGQTIDYIKIDVEGHELDCLIGAGESISAVKIIQFEFGGCNIDTRTYFQDFWYFFENTNFRVYRITPSGCKLIPAYKESDEYFLTTNFIAVNNSLVP